MEENGRELEAVDIRFVTNKIIKASLSSVMYYPLSLAILDVEV
jgi:hypothetical protein